MRLAYPFRLGLWNARKNFFLLAMVLLVAMSSNPLAAEDLFEQLRQSSPSFLVRIAVDQVKPIYREGEHLSISVVSEEDAFAYVLYEQSDGQVFQIFPNSAQQDNAIKARQAIRIPAAEDRFRWRIGPPFGNEKLMVIATKVPLKTLEGPQLRSKRFNAVDSSHLKGIGMELGDERIQVNPVEQAIEWAEDSLEIQTVAKTDAVAVPQNKRVGAFFGVSQHRFAFLEETITGRSPNLASPHRDARKLAETMKSVGRLEEVKYFTNEQATRQSLEESITQWLPSITQPGDTVFIYFSGHGGQVETNNPNEPDRMDEFLIPNDYLGLNAVAGLLEQSEQGNLPDEFKELVPIAKDLLQKAGGSIEKANLFLISNTAVTDDQFGHWLQHLDGRQVVVILDICHSGGFAVAEKSLLADARQQNASKSFDFLDREMGRLKDIGQTDTVLFTASSTQELSLVRLENDLSVMTYYLIETINNATGALEIRQAFQGCSQGMKAYFESPIFLELNEELENRGSQPLQPHAPKLYSDVGQKNIYLRFQ